MGIVAMKITDAVIFITGANRGLGLALAQEALRRGAQKVYAGMRNIADFNQQGIIPVIVDVTDPISIQNAVAQCGDVNILVNNAGILYSGAFEKTDISAHHRTININVNGVLNGCHAALPYLRKAKFARVINLSSASAIYGQADLVSYSASKFAVRGITEGLDVEWQKYGIRVLDVMPLFVQTAMVKNMDAGTIQKIGVDLSPQDVAEKILTLARTKGSILTATHTPIGFKTKLMYQLSNLSPQVINRLTNLVISKKKP